MLLEASVARLRRLRDVDEAADSKALGVAGVVPPIPVPVQLTAAVPELPPAPKLSPTSTLPAPIPPPLSKADEVRARRRARKLGDVARVPRLSRRSRILNNKAAGTDLAHVMAALPLRYRSRDLQCAYSSADDGVSLGTLYARAAGDEPVVLLVRDAGGATFGAFSTVPFKACAGMRYCGSGEAFCFSVRPTPAVYKWTRANSFFQLCQGESLAIGGGGAFALFLDSMLEHGSSGESATFDNRCLASAASFQIVVVELWKLVVPCRWHADLPVQ